MSWLGKRLCVMEECVGKHVSSLPCSCRDAFNCNAASLKDGIGGNAGRRRSGGKNSFVTVGESMVTGSTDTNINLWNSMSAYQCVTVINTEICRK